ncbi:Serine/threonine-protein kinase, partial [Rhizophlyctis rosea]
MGNIVSPATPRTAPAGIDSYVSELSELQYEKSLGSARFMKTIKCKHPEGQVVVKIFIKPEPNISLRKYVKALQAERNILTDIPNAFPYQRIFETEKAGYMIRQYFANNLYDRISTRPFLDQIEKKWIAYQILAGIAEAHAHQIYHGDIKTENVLVTSWNWAHICDFSPFKPAYLPEDNPADFSFFFDTSSRRVCYLAPERFYAPGETLFSERNDKLTAAMDIFSLGCTIAELFMEGTPLFSFSQLLRYRSGEYDPTLELEKIEDKHVKDLIKHMIQIDPANRFTAEQYLAKWRGTAFPEYFYSFLHRYVASITDGSTAAHPSVYQVRSPTTAAVAVADADAKIDRIYQDFDKIVVALGLPNPAVDEGGREETVKGTNLLPVNLCVPNYTISSTTIKRLPNIGDRCLLLTTILCSAIRNAIYPSSKLYALDLLLALGVQLEDQFRLERIVPYLVSVLGDESARVRAGSVRVLAQVMAMIDTITPGDANIFSEYLLPNLKKFSSDSEAFVRATYACCIANFAEAALKILELSQLLKNEHPSDLENDTNLYQMTYDASLRDLQEAIQDEVVTLLIDPDPMVKRALLGDMPRLCIFFGRQRANDVLLSHMITYLNDLDWGLRCAFFESIVGVGTFVGGRSLEEYILPLMVQALTDAEEFVVEKVLNSLTSLAELGLLQKYKLKELAGTILPL